MSDSAPLTPEQIDLLLSADLDGEFDAAASDLRLEPAAARALLESVPGVAARGADLAAARDHLAAPIEIDELLAARLRAKAVNAGAEAAEAAHREQRHRRTRLYGLVSGVAAALLVVVALGATLRTGGSSDDMSTSASGAPDREVTAPTTSDGAAPAGDTADQAARSLPLATAYSSVDDLAADVRARSSEFGLPAPAAAEAVNGSGSDKADANKCGAVAKAVDQAAGDPIAAGTTRVAGEPLSALLFVSADGRTLYFFDADCRLVNRQLIN
jgi:hypothetical protein